MGLGEDRRRPLWREIESTYLDAAHTGAGGTVWRGGGMCCRSMKLEGRAGDAAGTVRARLYEASWLGLYPSPDGQTVAAFQCFDPTDESDRQEQRAVDLVLFDLAGQEKALFRGVSLDGSQVPYDYRIPAAWLPDGTGLVFVDRPAGPAASGEDAASAPAATRLARLDLAGAAAGAVIPIPGTEGALPEPPAIRAPPWTGRPTASGSTSTGRGNVRFPLVYQRALEREAGATLEL